jgi:TPR repeat protein
MAFRRWLSRFSTEARQMRRASRLLAAGDAIRALRVLMRAADRGSAEANLRVARAYLDGRGVPANATEGMRWLERAARLDHVPAQALLAALLLRGLGAAPRERSTAEIFHDRARPDPVAAPEPSFEHAVAWARKASSAGSPDAQAVLAYILTSGPDEYRDLEQAHELYRKAAEAGSAQGALGHAIALAGRNPDLDGQRDIARWLEIAAKAGLPTAYYLLGEAHERGIAGVQDLTAAVENYRLAAEQGHRSAQAKYGLALLLGRGTEKETVSGESWLRRAALAGDAEAVALVGDLYARGGELPPNYLEAALWYRRAAEAGHRVAARALGLLYLTGAGVARDADEAATWFRVAAERGDTVAQADLGNLALRGVGTTEDVARTPEWFRTAAEQGDTTAAFNLAVCLLEGVGTERDPAQAARWLRGAAESLPNAQFWYGRLMVEGNGVEQDIPQGRAWIEKAAASGLVQAQVQIGTMLVNGEGGMKDHVAAQVWFARAASSGHPGAMFALGALAGGGHDVPEDRELAQKWYRAAADKGHAHARLMLGRYLARGLAGQTDYAMARHWLQLARDQGLTEADPDLASLPQAGPMEAAG